MWKLSVGFVLVAVTSVSKLAPANAFSVSTLPLVVRSASHTTTTTLSMTTTESTTRRQLLQSSRAAVIAAVTAACFSSSQPAVADVADGSALPQGAAQFSRILRLKVDLVAIEKRVSSKAIEIDSNEWNDLGQFLRRIYLVGDDMKVVAGGIFDPDQKKRAEEAISLLKRYAQAGDIAVNKKDPDGFVLVIQKLENQVEDFLDSLRDVPDEI